MHDFLGIEIDTANMTLEELYEIKSKIRKMLVNVEYQILLKQMEKRKSSCQSTPTEV